MKKFLSIFITLVAFIVNVNASGIKYEKSYQLTSNLVYSYQLAEDNSANWWVFVSNTNTRITYMCVVPMGEGNLVINNRGYLDQVNDEIFEEFPGLTSDELFKNKTYLKLIKPFVDMVDNMVEVSEPDYLIYREGFYLNGVYHRCRFVEDYELFRINY